MLREKIVFKNYPETSYGFQNVRRENLAATKQIKFLPWMHRGRNRFFRSLRKDSIEWEFCLHKRWFYWSLYTMHKSIDRKHQECRPTKIPRIRYDLTYCTHLKKGHLFSHSRNSRIRKEWRESKRTNITHKTSNRSRKYPYKLMGKFCFFSFFASTILTPNTLHSHKSLEVHSMQRSISMASDGLQWVQNGNGDRTERSIKKKRAEI